MLVSREYYDFLVIGSGIAGLSYALKVADYGKVCIVTKDEPKESATKYAQGGIAAVMYDYDSYEKHINDTMIAGDDLNDIDVVRMTIKQSTARINDLIEWGVDFDKDRKTGNYHLSKEGGHSEFRVLHYKDKTGLKIEEALLAAVRKHQNIKLHTHSFAIDLLTQHQLGKEVKKSDPGIECYGAYVLDLKTHEIITMLARTTMIATGGIGMIYSTTTNPVVATGDGIAMVYRAKGGIEKMEFVQFHPTSLYMPGVQPSFLITEALRGFGALLKSKSGEEFMKKYDPRGCLAPRDIVARAIDNEIKISGDDYVVLDCTHLNKEELIDQFPTIYGKCLSLGIDITKDKIPVVPAAHYLCGGIHVDKKARSSIKHLYASGECASTGLHGANRLASNSLLESLVFSYNAAQDVLQYFSDIPFCEEIPNWDAEGKIMTEEMILITQSRKELQSIMSSYVGIVRSDLRLQRALDRLGIIYKEAEILYEKSVLSRKLCELRNMINVAFLVIRMAQERKESIGLHYSVDYPRRNKYR
ncbi:MAG: L-aspartate oxidase [Bacteroidales bacterium]|nr:L-aspartate oxidase [Bacteroidales bacterium]